ncbi:hypothetical protein EJB05_08190 [Eragrostis curvula]|uniref:Uncharacterized protein n=1 Tax=Eragrostis curvula TaxID=38414 RepID=A0A5J9WJW1_9POAL|nr:hypothetical protein EJB05_08190 [Eragrostis curvula]
MSKEGDGGKKEEGDGKKDGEAKKEDGGDGKKDGDGKKEGGGDKKPAVMPMPLHHLPPQYMNMITADYMNQYRPPPPPPAYPYVPPQYHYVRNMSMEENPNSCAIC